MVEKENGKRIVALVVNPIAGMGGKVALKGTDGVAEEAVKRGATPIAHSKALHFLSKLKELGILDRFEWRTAAGEMGEGALRECGAISTVSYSPQKRQTTSEDTQNASKSFLSGGCALVIFVGGDGTARDVHSAVNNKVPILGIPSGVKMHSGVFAVSPEAAAELMADWLGGKAGAQEGELIDLDEELYRKGEWKVMNFGLALTLFEPSYVQLGKEMYEAASHEDVLDGIADHVIEALAKTPDALVIMGPGSTVEFIGKKMGFEKTLLGVDCALGRKLVAKDADEKTILSLLGKHPKAKVIVSPIGSQGFIFGRGNLQLSSAVMRLIDLQDIIIVATPAKLASTPDIRVDFDDQEVVDKFNRKKYIPIVAGYHSSVMRKIG
ncbi:MAG: ATP-NAD kinase family protein [Euryarchaeota archaeon]|nr:ATP-NAD kinase family protein [Euryarchaeota archaeon]